MPSFYNPLLVSAFSETFLWEIKRCLSSREAELVPDRLLADAAHNSPFLVVFLSASRSHRERER